MKIGLFTPAWPGLNTPNGIVTAVRHNAAGLHSLGHDVVVIAMHQDLQSEEPNPFPVIYVQNRPWRILEKVKNRLGWPDVDHSVIADNIGDATKLAVREHGIDVLVIEETQGWAGLVQAQVPIPVVVTLHGPWLLHKAIQSVGDSAGDRRREAREEHAFRTVSGLTAPSRYVLDQTCKEIAIAAPKAVIRNPIPQTEYADQIARSPGSVLFVGRFDYHKGGDVMLEAFAEACRTHPDITLTFVGPDRGVRRGEDVLTLEEALLHLPTGVRNRINVLGAVKHDEIAMLRQSHAITAIASRFENLNYTLLEAMSSGSAVVSTDAGGPSEVIDDGQNGLLVPAGDPRKLAEGLLKLVEDESLAQKMAGRAKDHIAAEFAPAVVAEHWERFLKRVC